MVVCFATNSADTELELKEQRTSIVANKNALKITFVTAVKESLI